MSMARGCLLLLAFATAWGTLSGVLLSVLDKWAVLPRGVWMLALAGVGGLVITLGAVWAFDQCHRLVRCVQKFWHFDTPLASESGRVLLTKHPDVIDHQCLERGPDSLADSTGPTAYLAAVTKLAEKWDDLLRDHPGRCVAVRGDGWFVVADDSAQLFKRLTENGVSSDVIETRWLLPHMAPPRGRTRSPVA